MITFNDIFKSSFLENVSSVSIFDMVIALALAFGIGLFIFLVYKKTFSGVMYSSSFGVSLVALTMITTLVIVRFRTAIKEPLDIAFLFWSIAVGIVLAAGMIPLAVFGSAAIGVILLVFVNKKSHANPYIIVIRCDGAATEMHAKDFIERNVNRCVIKSKTVQKGSVEVNMEVRLRDENTGFINALAEMPGIQSAVLVSYNGDYMG